MKFNIDTIQHKINPKTKLPTKRATSRVKLLVAKFKKHFRASKLHPSKRSIAIIMIAVLMIPLIVLYNNKPTRAATAGLISSGKGMLAYGDTGNANNPRVRPWASGASNFSAEAATTTSVTPAQTVIKQSPTRINEWMLAVGDTSGNLQVLKSTDGGTTWTSVIASFAIGGTGTTRRFDLAYESNSGDGVLMYSKNATTNEIGYRTWAGSSWTAETSYDPGGTANVVTWIEISERANSDELAAAYLTNGATNNIGAFIWTGSTNTPGNATATSFGTCDQTAGTPDGVDRCMDINYESGSGRPVLSWGVSSAGNAATIITATRWNGSAWTNTMTSIGIGDDGTWIDCDSDPDPTSITIACGSYSASTVTVQAWTVVGGALGVAGLNIDTTAHAASAGHAYVATTYFYSGSTYRALVAYSDSAAGTGATFIGYSGTTWALQAITQTGYATVEESMIFVRNGATPSQGMLVVTDTANDLFSIKFDMDSAGVFTAVRSDSAAALETVVPATQGYPMDFIYEPARQKSVIDQKGYIFENDDEDTASGDAYDSNSQLAAGNTAISIQQGRRINIRAQLNNSGGALDGHPVGLFYDKNDGYWSRVKPTSKLQNSAGNCDNTQWNCSTINTADITGNENSIAIDPSGTPWIVYTDSGPLLTIAKYTGLGGSGCVAGNGWQCFSIDSAINFLGDTSIAIDSSGNPWISYYKNTGTAGTSGGFVARYVGTGGVGCSAGVTAWTCGKIVGSTGGAGTHTSIAFDSVGNAWAAFTGSSLGLTLVKYSVQAANWTSTLVDLTSTAILQTSLAVDNAGIPWVSYYDSNASNLNLRIAMFVGTGGSGCTGGSAAWTCRAIDTTGDVGTNSSVAIDPSGNPWVAYGDTTNSSVKLARYNPTGSFSTCAAGITDWDCVTVDNGGTNGAYTAMAFDPSGKAWITYNDAGTNNDLWVARYVGGAAGTGCVGGSTDWTCVAVNTTGSQGNYPAVAFDRNGKMTIAYQEYTVTTTLRVAQMAKSGEIIMAPTMGATAGDPLNESHSDMTSVADSAGRASVDCISTGSWTNGDADGGRESLIGLQTTGGTAGSGGCTEAEFTIDTSQATVGTTYRFVLATDDSSAAEKSSWRGPATITQYPTVTVTPDGSVRYGKSALYEPGTADCTADTSWSCTPVANWSGTDSWNELAYDSVTDTPWIGYYNLNASAAKYVGGGTGTGCGAGGSTDWNCWVVDAAGTNMKSAMDPFGNLWMAYYTAGTVANKNLGVAKYVGGGKGTGCSSTDWTCWLPDQTGDVGNNPAITFGPDGNPTIVEVDVTSGALKIVKYVGTGGNCAVTSWSCYSIDGATINGNGATGVVYDDSGTAWIAYRNSAGTGLKVAQFVGGGGTGCTLTTQWNCVTVDTSVAPLSVGMGMASTGPVVTYGSASNVLRYTSYVGTGGGCTSTAWNCINVMNNGGTYGQAGTSVSFDPAGNPWISFYSTGVPNSSFVYARYVGSGGSGCGAGLTSWSCVPVTSGTNNYGQYTNLIFNSAGEPMVSYGSSAGIGLISFGRLRSNKFKSSYSAGGSVQQHNGVRSDGQWRLTSGRSPGTSGDQLCGGVNSNAGYCAVGTEDGSYDALSVKAKEKAMYTMRWEYPANSEAPGVAWVGKSTLAPSTAGTAGDLTLQVYRFGSTNAWEDVATDTATTDCSVRCSLSGMPVIGAVSDYYEASGSVYFAYFRLVQRETTGSFTLSTDSFKAEQTAKALRGGQYFRDGQKTPMNY